MRAPGWPYAAVMADPGTPSGRGLVVRLRTQMVLLQVVVVLMTLGLAFGVFAYVSGQRLSAEYGQRALAIARSVATDPAVRTEVSRYAAETLVPGPDLGAELARGQLQRVATDTGTRTDALFVVITDEQGVRLAHPNPVRLGEVADMADAVVFLCSDASRFINGAGLPVDGGMGM